MTLFQIFFQDWREEANLINVEPISVAPTSTNKRVGLHFIGKRLDRYLVKEDLFPSVKSSKSSIKAHKGSKFKPCNCDFGARN